MRALGEGRSNFDMVMKMLALMSKSYASLSSLMEKTKDLETVTYAERIGYTEHVKTRTMKDQSNYCRRKNL